MTYQSQEEHDHFEGAREQSVPEDTSGCTCLPFPRKDRDCPEHGNLYKPEELPKQDWITNFRNYFDKTLKSKKPTMQNLDREIIVYFIQEQVDRALENQKQKTVEEIKKWKNEGENPTETDLVLENILRALNK